METAAQGITATGLSAGLGCATGAQRTGAGEPDIDVVTGLIQLTGLVQGIYAHVSERHNLTSVQAKRRGPR